MRPSLELAARGLTKTYATLMGARYQVSAIPESPPSTDRPRDQPGQRHFVENVRMRVAPPPGQLIDVGSHRLHLHCHGAGGPAVVFDAALGASSLSWTYVLPEVASFARACAVDRAGFA